MISRMLEAQAEGRKPQGEPGTTKWWSRGKDVETNDLLLCHPSLVPAAFLEPRGVQRTEELGSRHRWIGTGEGLLMVSPPCLVDSAEV